MSRSWYILHTYTGYEGKIERSIKSLLETKEIDPNVVLDVKVPVFGHTFPLWNIFLFGLLGSFVVWFLVKFLR